jgi:hypothetical protein
MFGLDELRESATRCRLDLCKERSHMLLHESIQGGLFRAVALVMLVMNAGTTVRLEWLRTKGLSNRTAYPPIRASGNTS